MYLTKNVTVVLGIQHRYSRSYMLCYAYNKCSFHMLPYNSMAILLAIFLMLCLLFLWFINSITGRLYIPFPVTHSAHHPIALLLGNHQFLLYISRSHTVFIFVIYSFVFLDSIWWNYVYLSFSVWLISFTIIPWWVCYKKEQNFIHYYSGIYTI